MIDKMHERHRQLPFAATSGLRSLGTTLAVTVSIVALLLAGASPTAAAPAIAGTHAHGPRTLSAGPATAPTAVLTRNPLYRAPKMRSARCAPASQTPLADAASLQAYYLAVLPCLNAAWKKSWRPLARSGVKFKAPKVLVHDGNPASPCANTGPSSFYCPKNRTIYMYDREITDRWATWNDDYSHGLTRLTATHTLAHEYGHHVQELAGIIDGIGGRYSGAPGRRLELQASCLGNVWLSAQSDAYPILLDYAQRGQDWRYIPLADHGSIDNQRRWTDAGYATARAASCNTFRAPASQVR